MAADSLEVQVKRLIVEELPARFEQLTPDTSLFHHLGVDGADGWEFMETFSERFGVDISEFEPRRHFGPEAGCNPIVALVVLVFRPQWSRFIPITVADLVEAAQSRKWKTPDRAPV
jgi:acyl carrier protein